MQNTRTPGAAITSEAEYAAAVEALLRLDLRYEETKDPTALAEANQLGDVLQRYEVAAGHTPALTLAALLEGERVKRGLQPGQLAALLGVTEARLSELIRGKRKMNRDFARRLYTKLQIPADTILGLQA